MGGSGTGLDGMGLARYIRSMEAEQRKKKLVIQYGGEGKTIPLNDIYYMESRNHNIIPCFVGGGFREKKSKRDGIAAVLFILANIGIGLKDWQKPGSMGK